MTNWRNLFSAASNHSLEYFPPTFKNATHIVAPSKEVFAEGADEWKHTLVAQFLNKPLNLSLMQRVLESKLGRRKTLQQPFGTPKMTRDASKGVAQVFLDMKYRKARLLTNGVKKGGVSP